MCCYHPDGRKLTQTSRAVWIPATKQRRQLPTDALNLNSRHQVYSERGSSSRPAATPALAGWRRQTSSGQLAMASDSQDLRRGLDERAKKTPQMKEPKRGGDCPPLSCHKGALTTLQSVGPTTGGSTGRKHRAKQKCSQCVETLRLLTLSWKLFGSRYIHIEA